jgi:hypothetical protein
MKPRLECLLKPRVVARVEGCSLTTVYKRLASGEYEGFKDGPMTLVTEASIVRRREKLIKATYGARKGVKGVPTAAPAARPQSRERS